MFLVSLNIISTFFNKFTLAVLLIFTASFSLSLRAVTPSVADLSFSKMGYLIQQIVYQIPTNCKFRGMTHPIPSYSTNLPKPIMCHIHDKPTHINHTCSSFREVLKSLQQKVPSTTTKAKERQTKRLRMNFMVPL